MQLELPHTLLFDIEGTVGDVAFVRDVMFPYARTRLRAFLHAEAARPEVAAIVAETRREAGLSDTCTIDQVASALEAWSDADRKITPLKTLQGLVWAAGFADGTLVAHLYPDAAEALRRWHAEGRRLAVYSSGSVRAQQLYFGHSVAGDLAPLFSGWFDTTTGPKAEAASYLAIAAKLGVPPAELLFFSDAPAEIAAARAAGVRAVRIDRARAPEHLAEDAGGLVAGSLAPWLALGRT